jgi:hypothetical protein
VGGNVPGASELPGGRRIFSTEFKRTGHLLSRCGGGNGGARPAGAQRVLARAGNHEARRDGDCRSLVYSMDYGQLETAQPPILELRDYDGDTIDSRRNYFAGMGLAVCSSGQRISKLWRGPEHFPCAAAGSCCRIYRDNTDYYAGGLLLAAQEGLRGLGEFRMGYGVGRRGHPCDFTQIGSIQSAFTHTGYARTCAQVQGTSARWLNIASHHQGSFCLSILAMAGRDSALSLRAFLTGEPAASPCGGAHVYTFGSRAFNSRGSNSEQPSRSERSDRVTGDYAHRFSSTSSRNQLFCGNQDEHF